VGAEKWFLVESTKTKCSNRDRTVRLGAVWARIGGDVFNDCHVNMLIIIYVYEGYDPQDTTWDVVHHRYYWYVKTNTTLVRVGAEKWFLVESTKTKGSNRDRTVKLGAVWARIGGDVLNIVKWDEAYINTPYKSHVRLRDFDPCFAMLSRQN